MFPGRVMRDADSTARALTCGARMRFGLRDDLIDRKLMFPAGE
jgi:hypothetical protein